MCVTVTERECVTRERERERERERGGVEERRALKLCQKYDFFDRLLYVCDVKLFFYGFNYGLRVSSLVLSYHFSTLFKSGTGPIKISKHKFCAILFFQAF